MNYVLTLVPEAGTQWDVKNPFPKPIVFEKRAEYLRDDQGDYILDEQGKKQYAPLTVGRFDLEQLEEGSPDAIVILIMLKDKNEKLKGRVNIPDADDLEAKLSGAHLITKGLVRRTILEHYNRLSKNHLSIVKRGDKYFVIDTSKNGTYWLTKSGSDWESKQLERGKEEPLENGKYLDLAHVLRYLVKIESRKERNVRKSTREFRFKGDQ